MSYMTSMTSYFPYILLAVPSLGVYNQNTVNENRLGLYFVCSVLGLIQSLSGFAVVH